MINEVLEAEDYMRGKNIDQANTFRMVNLIVRRLHEQGKSGIEIRDFVFQWANRHGLFIDYSVNQMIYNAEHSSSQLRGPTDVYVSKQDVLNINRHVDQKVCKRVALAMLCFAKVAADKNGHFQIQSNALGSWIGVHPGNVRGKYIKELVDFAYLEKVSDAHKAKQWNQFDVRRRPAEWYRILEDVKNEGEWKLDGNDIKGLFEEIYRG